MDEDSAQKLHKTRLLYRDACNFLVKYVCLDPNERNWQRYNLHHAAYYDLRSALPVLGSQLACNAIRSVSSAYKTELTNHPRKNKEEPLKEIVFKNPSIHLDKNTIRYQSDMTEATVFTVEGRVKVRLCPGDFQKRLLASGKRKESNLVYRKNKKGGFWFLHISLEYDSTLSILTEKLKKEEVIGVDVGENNIAAVSSDKVWKAGRDKYLGLRARLQSNGSQSARQHLRKASGKERRHVTHVNHAVSKSIVEEAAKQKATVIVLEDLTHIRDRVRAGKRVRSRLHRWSFRELQQLIEYKAQRRGINVMYVDPRYTSQTCLQGLGYQLIAQGLL